GQVGPAEEQRQSQPLPEAAPAASLPEPHRALRADGADAGQDEPERQERHDESPRVSHHRSPPPPEAGLPAVRLFSAQRVAPGIPGVPEQVPSSQSAASQPRSSASNVPD